MLRDILCGLHVPVLFIIIIISFVTDHYKIDFAKPKKTMQYLTEEQIDMVNKVPNDYKKHIFVSKNFMFIRKIYSTFHDILEVYNQDSLINKFLVNKKDSIDYLIYNNEYNIVVTAPSGMTSIHERQIVSYGGIYLEGYGTLARWLNMNKNKDVFKNYKSELMEYPVQVFPETSGIMPIKMNFMDIYMNIFAEN